MAGKKPWVLASVIALALGAATPVLAYILPAEAILARVASHRVGLGIKRLVLEGTHQQGEVESRVWLAVRSGRAYRQQTVQGDRTLVELTAGDRRWSFNLGGAAGVPKRVTDDLILNFLLPKSKDSGGRRGLAFLARHKIDPEMVSLSRIDKRIAYVIGAKPWETTKPQLWIDKDLRVPVRLLTVDSKTNVVREQRLIGFGGELVDQWFPRRIEWRENGQLIQSIEFDKIDVNPDLDKDLFATPS